MLRVAVFVEEAERTSADLVQLYRRENGHRSRDGVLLAEPFLDIAALMPELNAFFDERGLDELAPDLERIREAAGRLLGLVEGVFRAESAEPTPPAPACTSKVSPGWSLVRSTREYQPRWKG